MALTTITNPMVSVNAIQGTLIADNAITAVHIATNAVSGTLIADNAITATHIAQNIITVTQLADDAVEADKIADSVITTNHLNKAMISSQTEVSAVAGDYVLLGDTSDSNNLKKAPISSILAGTLTTAAQTNITSLGTLTALAVDNITIDGSEIDSTGSLDLDVATNMTIDVGGGIVRYYDDGTEFAQWKNNSSDLQIISIVDDKDIIFRGSDAGTYLNALTLDMSEAGAATFNSSFNNGSVNHIANQIQSGYGDNSDNSDIWINYTGYQGGTTYFRDFRVGNGKQSQLFFVDGSAGTVAVTNALTAGSLTVGNSNIGSNTSHLANLTINNNAYIGSAGNTTAIKIATSGAVTMGYADLTITADNARLLVEEADGTNIAWVGDHTGDGHGGLLLYNHGGTATVKLTADSHANYINNGNNFGIGTASPANKLQVGATTGGYGGNHFHIGDGTTAFAIYLDPTTDNSHFYTNTSYSFLKSGGSTGYVGINTTTPQKTLHIEHTAGASEGILISGASDTTGHTAGILLRAEGGEADSTLRAKGGIFFERTGTYGVGKLHLCNNDSDNNNSTTLSDARLTLNEDVTEVKRPLVNKINNGSVNGNAKHYTNLAAADLYNESNGYTIIDTKIPHYGYTNDRNMIMIRMQGYGYDADDTGTIDFTVGAYVGESATHNPTCSGPAIPNAWKGNIYFYRNTSTNCVSVVLGTSSSLVNYSLVVTDFIQSFTNQVEGHAVGWNIKRAANLTGYDRGTSIRNRFSTSVPAFRAYLGSTTSVSAGTSTLTSGMTENFDKQGNFNPSNGRFTAPQSGIYQFNATVTMAASTTSVTYLSAEVVHTPSGGSAQRYVVGGWNSKTSTTNAYASSAGSVTIEMNAGDYVVLGYETSAAINLQGSLGHTSISGFLVA